MSTYYGSVTYYDQRFFNLHENLEQICQPRNDGSCASCGGPLHTTAARTPNKRIDGRDECPYCGRLHSPRGRQSEIIAQSVTVINGPIDGPVFSGNFQGPIQYGNTYIANVESGATAVGPGAVAATNGSVAIGGNLGGTSRRTNIVIQGEGNNVRVEFDED